MPRWGPLRQPLRAQELLGAERAPRAAEALLPLHRVRRPHFLSLQFLLLFYFCFSFSLSKFCISFLCSNSFILPSFTPLSFFFSSAHAEPDIGCRRRRCRTGGRRCGCTRLSHERTVDALARVLRALACVRRLGHRLLAPVALNAIQPAVAEATLKRMKLSVEDLWNIFLSN